MLSSYLSDSRLLSIAIPVGLFVGVVLLGLVIRGMLFRALEAWSKRSTTRFDDLLIQSIRRPFILWIVILALLIATRSSEMPPRITDLVSKALLVLWVISLTLVASKLAGALVGYYGNRVTDGGTTTHQVTTLSQSIASLIIGAIGVLILLDSLQISITPILTALGVGGLAVALALQDTLSNLFAGFYVTIAGQVRVGDYVKLDGGQEGFVSDINWRSTTIRALANNLIVVPNAKLAQAIVTNFYLPERRTSALVQVGVSYDNDPDDIERVLLEEANTAIADGNIKGLLADPPPIVRFNPGFGASSLDFTLICQVAEFTDQFLVQHEMRKRIFKRFRRDGIEIPYPTQSLYVKEQQQHQA
ncbi:membrane protein [Bryobacterales bacterium F-183]|nr:membrane protein [Bryobacterales bacterium F-183]